MLSLCSDCNPKSRQVPMNDRIPAFNRKKQIDMVWLRNTDEAALLHKQWSEHLLSLKEQYCAREQRLDWMLPVSRVASEGGRQSSDPINSMKSLRWYQRAPKLPLTPQGFSMSIQQQFRGFWLEPVLGPLGRKCNDDLNLNSDFDLLRDGSSETKTDCLDLTLCRLRVQKAAGRYW